MAWARNNRLFSENHLPGSYWSGCHHQPAHPLSLLHLPRETFAILLPPVESQVFRRASICLSTSRARLAWCSTEEAGPPSRSIRHDPFLMFAPFSFSTADFCGSYFYSRAAPASPTPPGARPKEKVPRLDTITFSRLDTMTFSRKEK